MPPWQRGTGTGSDKVPDDEVHDDEVHDDKPDLDNGRPAEPLDDVANSAEQGDAAQPAGQAPPDAPACAAQRVVAAPLQAQDKPPGRPVSAPIRICSSSAGMNVPVRRRSFSSDQRH
jgi:hypothetical protein